MAKNLRPGYSPGCCKRIHLQPQSPVPKLTLCFDTQEEAQQWSDAIQWAQQAREILDSADAAAAAALEVPIQREESQTLTLAAIDSLPELLPDLDNVADLTPPPPRAPAPLPLRPVHALAPPLSPAQPLPPPPPPAVQANAPHNSELAPAFVMLDISELNLPRLSEIEDA
jgi:hypothetical protein